MIWFVIAAIVAAAGGAAVTIVFWNKVVSVVTDWLTRHNLNKAVLSSALVRLDRLVVGIRRRVRVKTPLRGRETIADEVINISDIDDPQLRAQLERQTRVNVDILGQI